MKPFEQYVRLLLDLHVEMSAGRGDDDKADRIRDDMDSPWYAMSNIERQLASAVSEGLYANNRLDKLSISWNRDI